MSRRRTGHLPGQWVDEGGATPNVMQTARGLRQAAVVGDMRPVVGLPAVRTDAARANDARQRQTRSERP